MMRFWYSLKSAVKFFIFFCFIPMVEAAKLAIVIDDIGYHLEEDFAIYALPKEVSVAIIPSAPYAQERNEQAQRQQRDILIHLPMQPLGEIAIEEGGLTLGMRQFEVNMQVEAAKKVVTYAIGLNNHMGSAATVDEELMTKLMITLRQNALAFLDSRTNVDSVAARVAREQGVKVLQRHFFLDDDNKYANVYQQFQQAVTYARKNGAVIMIGHPRANTIRVLQEGLARLPKDIELVKISQLWRESPIFDVKQIILLFSGMAASTSSAPFDHLLMLRGVPK